MAGIKAKLNSRFRLINLLPARTGGTDEFFLDLRHVDGDGVGYFDFSWLHLSLLRGSL